MSHPKKSHIPPFRRVLAALSATAVQETEREVAAFAEEERGTFVRRVERQDFPDFDASPLNPKYRATKIRLGLDPRVMIRTHHYLDSIQVFRERQTKYRTRFRVGFAKNEMARDAKGQRVPYPLWKLAAVQEHGSVKMHIPRRRHWKPHYEAMRGRAPRVRARVRRLVRERMKKKFPAVLG